MVVDFEDTEQRRLILSHSQLHAAR